ncbi:hypothetical protein [Thermus sp.]|uniref:hypothetical protein n=1 Tax=Thermus sp. TaxID=275 RepID=UPI003D130211
MKSKAKSGKVGRGPFIKGIGRGNLPLFVALLLLLGASGCNLNSGPPPKPPLEALCSAPIVEDSFKNLECTSLRQTYPRRPLVPLSGDWPNYFPKEGVTLSVGYPQGIGPGKTMTDLDRVSETLYFNMGEGALGTTLRYYRLPGFPEKRFLVGRTYPPHAMAYCPEFTTYPPAFVPEKCYFFLRDPYQDGMQALAYRISYYPGGGTTIAPAGSGSLAGDLYPLLQGKDGSTESFLEFVWQIEVPTAEAPFPKEWAYIGLPPGHPKYSVWSGPYFALEDLYAALTQYRGPDWGKTYSAKVRFRYDLLPGPKVHLTLPDWVDLLRSPVAVDFRRLYAYDAHPMSKGYFDHLPVLLFYGHGGIDDVPPRQGVVAEAAKPENVYGPANDDFYVFQEASGHVTPPAPVCFPDGKHNVYFLLGPYQPRSVPLEPYVPYPTTNLDEWRLGIQMSLVNYTHHLVTTVGREARVVGYYVGMNLGARGDGNGYGGRDDMPRAFPVFLGDAPNPYVALGRGVERYAVFYRSTARFGWRPAPDHTPYEDRWKVVWSDVRLGDGGDCAVERIGFHVFSPGESQALDQAFGLAEVETYDTIGNEMPYGRDFGVGTHTDRRGPMLTALYAAPSTTSSYFAWHYLNKVAPGEVRVPVLPPGW